MIRAPSPSACLLWAGCAVAARAEVALAPVFGDHMVLQRECPLPVWGSAAPGETVTVSFAGSRAQVVAGTDGRWQVVLPPQGLSNQPREFSVAGSNTLILSDVLVGDVWLGCGQSNMDWSASATDGADRIKATSDADFAGIRLFKVGEAQADAPQRTLSGAWAPAAARTALGFSATLYFFGEALHRKLPGVPLGLIRASLGATNLYCWMPDTVRSADPSCAYLRQWWGQALASWTPEKEAAMVTARTAYEAQVAELQRRRQPVPPELKKPGEVIGPHWSRRPGGLYNGMLAPLQPYALRGMLWYQGEWDAKPAWVKVYHDSFVATADAWRKAWSEAGGSGAFPIYLVQLPSRIPGDGDCWPYMREVQERLAGDVPDSGFVTTIDTCDGRELHPREKSAVGRRLAALALARSYGQSTRFRGPAFSDLSLEVGRLRVHLDTGDVLQSADGQPLRNFQVAGEDGRYVPAAAEIDGRDVLVSAAEVTAPRTVRYAFLPAPDRPNLVDGEGLPAAPFRSDRLPPPK